MAQTPNILIVMADQLAPHFTGAYGHEVAKTPHMDALADRGARFDGAYCNSPLCAPSRFSLMAGQHVSKIKAYDNAAEFPASVPTFAHFLKLAGYRTCLSGKMHFVGPDQKHGFEDRTTTDIYPADFTWTPNWAKNDERIPSWYHNMQTVKDSGMSLATYQIDYDEEVDFAAKRWLYDYARDKSQGRDGPFCMVASFIHPHDPYVARPEYWDLYDDDEIEMPTTPDATDGFSRRVMAGTEASSIPLTKDEVRAARRAYLANTTYFDSKIGSLVKVLEEIGELDNTIVIVTSDHGDMLGERGMWFKMSFFEHSARIPLIMAGPGIAKGAVKNACSLVDMFPTLLDIAGLDEGVLGHEIDGRSLLPLAQGQSDDTDEAIGEYLAEMAGAPVFMIRRGDYKYLHCDLDAPQLYNLAEDPSELVNLADDPDHAELAQAFANEVTERWDSVALTEEIMANQRMRLSLLKAMGAGQGDPDAWDFDPPSDASQQYVRNHMDWAHAEARFRFPPLKG